MSFEEAAPCRHAGAPREEVVASVANLIESMAREEVLLQRYGLTKEEYRDALPAAIESIRGSMSASVSDRKRFLEDLFGKMVREGAFVNFTKPRYGDDTVYRISVPGHGDVAIIQKGCPDGAHSSVRWSVPDWAEEVYLWWLCDSMRYEPGEHIAKGVNRLRQRFFSDLPGTLSGIIFHNHLCGTAYRNCPKIESATTVNQLAVPPPCIYVMPERAAQHHEWNWQGDQKRFFPSILLGGFGITHDKAPLYTGYVGFIRKAGTVRTTITSRFGPGRITTSRS